MELKSTSQISLAGIRERRREAYLSSINNDQTKAYGHDQLKFSGGYVTMRGLDEYDEILPVSRGRSLSQFLSQRETQSNKTTVLDVGCGQGMFLADVASQFNKDKFELNGISATDLRWGLPPAIAQAMANLNYQEGDIQRLRKYYRPESFDLITSVWSICYVADPWNVIKNAYRLLKPNGVAFLANLGISLTGEEEASLRRYWSALGYDIGMYADFDYTDPADRSPIKLILRRNQRPHLQLPFKYAGFGQPNKEGVLHLPINNDQMLIKYKLVLPND